MISFTPVKLAVHTRSGQGRNAWKRQAFGQLNGLTELTSEL